MILSTFSDIEVKHNKNTMYIKYTERLMEFSVLQCLI